MKGKETAKTAILSPLRLLAIARTFLANSSRQAAAAYFASFLQKLALAEIAAHLTPCRSQNI